MPTQLQLNTSMSRLAMLLNADTIMNCTAVFLPTSDDGNLDLRTLEIVKERFRKVWANTYADDIEIVFHSCNDRIKP